MTIDWSPIGGKTLERTVIFKQCYGKLNLQNDGRLSGHLMTITGKRKDGKYSVTHAFGDSKRINKIYTVEQLQWEIFKMERKEQEQTV